MARDELLTSQEPHQLRLVTMNDDPQATTDYYVAAEQDFIPSY